MTPSTILIRRAAFGVSAAALSFVGRFAPVPLRLPDDAVDTVPPCRVAAPDTASWRESSSMALRFTFRRPPIYTERTGEMVGPGGQIVSSEWWHEDGPAWTLEFRRGRMPSDSARHARARRLRDYHECMLATASGPVRVELFRDGSAGYGANAVTLYMAEMDWPRANDGESLHLEAKSRDKPRLEEQLAIAQTVELIK